jgi:type I restriction enzyme R subunit
MKTDTSESGLEALIVKAMTESGLDTACGWILGNWKDYDREYALDVVQLSAFLAATQPNVIEAVDLGNDSPTRRKLRHAVARSATPSPGNPKAEERFAQNRFSVTRQLATAWTRRAARSTWCLFINGLPIATFELKNSLTKQTVEDASSSTSATAIPRERLFEFGRCVVHFAVDDSEVRLCTHLKGKGRGSCRSTRAGTTARATRPTRHGLKTDYLWKEILTPAG